MFICICILFIRRRRRGVFYLLPVLKKNGRLQSVFFLVVLGPVQHGSLLHDHMRSGKGMDVFIAVLYILMKADRYMLQLER